MEKQKSFKMKVIQKQLSFKTDHLERQHSIKNGVCERQKSIKLGPIEKQKSFRMMAMEKQESFQERKSRDSPRKRGDSLLHLAARAGNLAQVKEILGGCNDAKAKEMISTLNQDRETAMYVAAENGHASVVRELLKHSDIQTAALKATNTFDAFHVAARQGHLDVLKELLSFFPELAMTCSANATALDTAATQGHVEIVNLLLDTAPGLTKIARSNGKTVLHSAARMGHVDVVKSLLDNDSTIGIRTDKKGQTALHMAAKGQNIEVVLELLKPDSSIINCEDNKGNTPLHIATRKGRFQILQKLLTIDGGDVNAFNKAGETALDIAEKCNHEEIAAFLKENGAVKAKDLANPPNPAKQLKKAVSDIKHEVQSQLQQSRQTGMHVHKIRKKLKKLHIGGLNNAINSNTVVAVLIATVAFAAIFTVPGQYVQDDEPGFTLGQAYIAQGSPFIIFFVSDAVALFISLSVVVVQTSLIVTEQKAKAQMVFVINKLMWLACVFISIAFISLSFVVVDNNDLWLAWLTTAIGGLIMLATIGSMCYCIIMHQIDQKNKSKIRRASTCQSRSWSLVNSDSENMNTRLYAL